MFVLLVWLVTWHSINVVNLTPGVVLLDVRCGPRWQDDGHKAHIRRHLHLLCRQNHQGPGANEPAGNRLYHQLRSHSGEAINRSSCASTNESSLIIIRVVSPLPVPFSGLNLLFLRPHWCVCDVICIVTHRHCYVNIDNHYKNQWLT